MWYITNNFTNSLNVNDNRYLIYNDIFTIQWNRIIFDNINKLINNDKSILKYYLKFKAKYKWCLTNKPFYHKYEGFFNIIKMILNNYDPNIYLNDYLILKNIYDNCFVGNIIENFPINIGKY